MSYPSRGGRIIGLEEDMADCGAFSLRASMQRSLSGSGGTSDSGYSAATSGSGGSSSSSSKRTASFPRRRLHSFDQHLKEAALERAAVGLVVARVLDDGRPVAQRLVPDYRREDLEVGEYACMYAHLVFLENDLAC